MQNDNPERTLYRRKLQCDKAKQDKKEEKPGIIVKEAPKRRIGLKRLGGHLLIVICGVPLLFLVSETIWRGPCDSQAYRYPRAPEFTGPLAKNTWLSQAEKLVDGRVLGPEAITVTNGVIYTGSADGRVLRIRDGVIETVTSTGSITCDAGDTSKEAMCGRPLGARLDRNGNLLVVDTLYGLYRINVYSGVKELLFSTNYPLDGKRSLFLNDVAVSTDGTIYISDSSTKWTRSQFLMLGLENRPDGRIIRISPVDGSATVLLDQITPNGIQLSSDETELIIADVVRARLLRLKLSSEYQGSDDRLTVFSENLPGNPDNIRNSSGGGYWVALTAVRQPDKPPVWETLGPFPWARDILCKLYNVWTNEQFTQIRNMVYPQKKGKAKKKYGLIIEVDKDGNLLRSLHDPTGRVVGVSHVEEYGGFLYLGSAFNDYIGKLNLQDLR